MNSKQRRKNKRSKLVGLVDDLTPRLMNDFCPYMFECDNPQYRDTWKCFGKYESCDYYKKRNI